MNNSEILKGERGNIENKQRNGGKKKKPTAQDDRILFRRVKGNRRKTFKDLTYRLNNRIGCNVSERAVRRRLSSDGYRRSAVSKRITIYPVSTKSDKNVFAGIHEQFVKIGLELFSLMKLKSYGVIITNS
mgnify:CR=1 FL=1